MNRQALVYCTGAEANGAESQELAVLVNPLFVELVVAGKWTDNRSISSISAINIDTGRGREWERLSNILIG